ncbi:MAG TPA: membrane protein insertase YidC [Deltaproteobacteria bacterium]|nr:membrane protein insertase YidC [Deltaproteobacteria bacterium]
MMDENQRTMLALAISALILVAWFALFDSLNIGRKEAPETANQEKKATSAPQTLQGKPGQAPGNLPAGPAPVQAAAPQQETERTIVVDTDLYRATFSTRGARLTSFKLKKYPITMEKGSDPVEMIKAPVPGLDIEGIGSDAGLVFTTPARDRVTLNGSGGSIEFRREVAAGVTLVKTFTFQPGSYLVGFRVGLSNATGSPVRLSGRLVFDSVYPLSEKIKGYAFQGPVLLNDNRLEEFKIDKVKKPGAYREFTGSIGWFGVEDKYFLHTLVIPRPYQTTVTVRRLDDRVVELSCALPTLTVKQATAVAIDHSLFIGPKELNTLKAAGNELARALDFGFFDFIAKPLLVAMNWINRYTLSYGISIIVLTVIIKILLYPLTLKSFKSMKELQKIQPLMKEIQNQYKDDKQKMNQELMRLYQEHKINPMGGCLPMLLQIPILFALYRVFYQAIELRHTPFHIVGTWLPDLSEKDPYYITPILMGLTQFVLQKMTPATGDPTQQKVMLMMPIVFTFLFLNFPSGLVIYWLVSNLLSIVQQAYINRKHA